MQRALSLVRQGIWKCANARHGNNFINSTALLSNLGTRLGSWLNQTAKRAATPSLKEVAAPLLRPSSMWLRHAASSTYPGTRSTWRRSFCSRRRISRRGDELYDPLQPLLNQSISRLTWRTGSLGPCQLALAHPDPARRVGGCKNTSSPNLEKYLSTLYSDTLAPFSLQLKRPRKTLCKEVLHCFYFVGLPVDLSMRVWFN